MTKDEAREILFSENNDQTESGDDGGRSLESYKSEIKFLRELVERLSSNKNEIITTIREIEVPWKRFDWYTPYRWYCGNVYTSDPLVYCSTSAGSLANATSFNSIQTFN